MSEEYSLADESIFEHYNTIKTNFTLPSIIAGSLATKFLTPNGVILLKGSQPAFDGSCAYAGRANSAVVTSNDEKA